MLAHCVQYCFRIGDEHFLFLFSRRAEPDYYDAVTTPMDLSMIQQKLKNEEYDDVEQMSSDIHLIVTNAKTVYGVCVLPINCYPFIIILVV